MSEKKKKRVDKEVRKISADRKHILAETEKPKRYAQPHSLFIKVKVTENLESLIG